MRSSRVSVLLLFSRECIVMSEVLERWLNQGQTVIDNGLLEHYQKIGLNSEELIFVIQLKSYLDQNHYFPNLAEIAERMALTEPKVFSMLHDLIQRKIIVIQTEKDGSGKDSDRYSLLPLFKKLALLLEKNETNPTDGANGIDLLEVFQQEFGRLLTPIEIQMIGDWLDKDKYSKELVLEALREAVLNQKYSLRYIDRILMAWEKKNIRTSIQVKEETKKFNAYQGQNREVESNGPTERIPLFNWLETSE